MGLRSWISGRSGTILELLAFLRDNKKWWMIPLVLVALLLCALFFLATQSPITPFVYTLF